jgi:hypothetical protein
MEVTDYSLFPTRLLTIQFADTDSVNAELCGLFDSRTGFAGDFNMHPDALNLLRLADRVQAIARLRDWFVEAVKHWLTAEGVTGLAGADLVLFSNYAGRGEFTMVHNHNADLVGIYYARTEAHDRSPVQQPDDADDYFAPGDGVLVLHDPRFNANLTAVGQRNYVKIFPRPGLMLIFPAYLWHSVTPCRGEPHRVSFAMNVTLRWPGGATAEYHPWT